MATKVAPSKAASAASGIKIAACGCKSEYQDARYGPGKRVHNMGAKFMTCTVCSYKRAV